MKYFLSVFILTLLVCVAIAQTPQIAVVRPNGTTVICTTFDSAYTIAADDDFVYLPGGHFTATNPIDKRIHIYGAGYNPDSSVATGITTINSLVVLGGAAGGSLSGIKVNSTCDVACLRFGDNSIPVESYLISHCNLTGGIAFISESSGFTIHNNLIAGVLCQFVPYSMYGNLRNSIITNNILTAAGLSITSNLEEQANLLIANNIFFWGSSIYSGALVNYSTYENNIFQSGEAYYVAYSIFNNNLNGNFNGQENSFTGQLNETWDLTFVLPGSADIYGIYPGYDVHNDYHVKVTSACHESGTDGTDRGIYGGAFPWVEGSIPNNPHIYFKQIGNLTGSDGRLHIQVGVRTDDD